MESMNISLPADLKGFVNAEVESGGYAGASDLVRELLRERRQQRAKARLLEALFADEGVHTDDADAMFDEIEADLEAGRL
jgi:antitoxin ParD1/3/4